MTIDFYYEIQIIKPQYHRKYSSFTLENKLDNFMLRGAMRFSNFHADFHEAFKATFYYQFEKKLCKNHCGDE